jgi:DNA-binding response OmpR family regulator
MLTAHMPSLAWSLEMRCLRDRSGSEEQALYSVAVVEDETLTRRAIALSLREAGFTVHEASDALSCRALLRQTNLDLIVLDLGLPGVDGMTFARELRGSNMGLIVVTRQSAPEARIAALDLGADDYLVKPIHYGELAARIRSVMRRSGRGRRKKLGRWIVDLEARTVNEGTLSANLTRGEFDILARLIQAGSKIVTRQELSSIISRSAESDGRTVDALVSRLRRKLDDSEGTSLIATAPGFGYRLAASPEES